MTSPIKLSTGWPGNVCKPLKKMCVLGTPYRPTCSYFIPNTDDTKRMSGTLKQLQMTIHDDYGYCKLPGKASELKICAESLDRVDDICQGDSGGPLACTEGDD